MPGELVATIVGISQRVITIVVASASCGKCAMSGTYQGAKPRAERGGRRGSTISSAMITVAGQAPRLVFAIGCDVVGEDRHERADQRAVEDAEQDRRHDRARRGTRPAPSYAPK